MLLQSRDNKPTERAVVYEINMRKAALFVLFIACFASQGKGLDRLLFLAAIARDSLPDLRHNRQAARAPKQSTQFIYAKNIAG
ncbi:hypothetical protein [Chitinimonas sp.]|uniref:hypothetical protein n=1 Tax=Chitinimonas sp. TaxID=1934313 RepID=UPI0035B291FB